MHGFRFRTFSGDELRRYLMVAPEDTDAREELLARASGTEYVEADLLEDEKTRATGAEMDAKQQEDRAEELQDENDGLASQVVRLTDLNDGLVAEVRDLRKQIEAAGLDLV